MVADGAQILAKPLSARVMAMAGLVGGARWCVVGRESMSIVESASERMRVRLSSTTTPYEIASQYLYYNHCLSLEVGPALYQGCRRHSILCSNHTFLHANLPRNLDLHPTYCRVLPRFLVSPARCLWWMWLIACSTEADQGISPRCSTGIRTMKLR